jgi:hypothetical protein
VNSGRGFRGNSAVHVTCAANYFLSKQEEMPPHLGKNSVHAAHPSYRPTKAPTNTATRPPHVCSALMLSISEGSLQLHNATQKAGDERFLFTRKMTSQSNNYVV